MTPTLMKETDIDDTYSGEYDVNNTHPYERVLCWWHPPQGICFWWHQPWESDVDDTHTGESDVENNALPPPRESDVDDASHHKIRHWKNFPMDGVWSRLSWIKSMTFFSHSSLQRTFDILAKISRSKSKGKHAGRQRLYFEAVFQFTFSWESTPGERSWRSANFVYWPLAVSQPKLSQIAQKIYQ